MKHLILILCLLLFSGLASVWTPAQGQDIAPAKRHYEVMIQPLTRAEIVELAKMDALDGVWGTRGRAYLTMDEIGEMTRRGLDVTVVPHPLDNDPGLRAGYHTFAELSSELQSIAASNPDICELYNIGDSHQGRELWFMKISDNVSVEEDEPEFKYISSMHGDEVVGMEMCMNLINLLVDDYGTDPQITNLVNEVEIWIMPLMNPDGYVSGQRYNAQGYDLNRNFPDRVDDPVNTPNGRPTEVQRIMNWNFVNYPVLSANFHGGALVVNYPYDSDPNPGAPYSATPDDQLIIQQSLTYSSTNIPMYTSSYFSQGITNGIAWYLVYGGMQDWNYVWMGCNEVCIELSNDKWPSYSQIPGFWNDNRESMLNYMDWCLKGIRGVVTNSITGAPLAATVEIVGKDHEIYTDPAIGDYHRMVLPGMHSLRVSAEGFQDQTISNIFVTSGDAKRVDVALVPSEPLTADKSQMSAAADSVVFTLKTSSYYQGRNYLLLAGVTGTSPGTPLPGGLATLPVNWDGFTDFELTLLNSPIFADFLGVLDTNGTAVATLNVSDLPSSVLGVVINFAFCMNNPFNYASNAEAVEIVP